MINFDDYTNENKINHNPNWPYIPDHPYRILIIGGSRSEKINTLSNLINNQPDIGKIYLYAKDPYEDKYHKKSTDEPYSFLVNDTTLSSDDPLRFRKNIYNIYN